MLDRNGLDPEIECACLPGCIDPRFDQAQEFVKDAVLQRDRQREDAVEPALDRWEIVDDPIRPGPSMLRPVSSSKRASVTASSLPVNSRPNQR
jgi:hypothetical protein